jgi:hypothetical protein
METEVWASKDDAGRQRRADREPEVLEWETTVLKPTDDDGRQRQTGRAGNGNRRGRRRRKKQEGNGVMEWKPKCWNGNRSGDVE